MTATKQFIEDAIKGGWGSHIGKEWRVSAGYVEHLQAYWAKSVWERVIAVPTILLDPLAWQAVGKTRGWLEHYDHLGKERDWHGQWHQFVSYLANGLSIEEALAKIAGLTNPQDH